MNNLKIDIKNKKSQRLVNINLLISFIVSLLGILTLYIYNTYYINLYLFDIGIIIFRTGLFIGTSSIMYAIFFEKYLE